MFKTLVSLLAVLNLGMPTWAGDSQEPAAPPAPLAHFHHVHLNATNPAAAIDFYTAKFDCEKARFGGEIDAVWGQESWMFFNKGDKPTKSGVTSAIWHIRSGGEGLETDYPKKPGNCTNVQAAIAR